MNTDLVTTITGLVVAGCVALGSYHAPAGVPTWLVVVGYVGAAAAAIHGYFTNKK
jgi:fatty acid desaturase